MKSINKDLFSSLLNKKNKSIDNQQDSDNSKILLPQIPFYGLPGTISYIEETKDSYYKNLYTANGTTTKIPVPKKQGKNKRRLLDDYYNDVKKYLEKTETKYLEYKNSKVIPTLSKKQFISLAIVTSLATLASLPFLTITSYIGLIFGTVSAFSLYVICETYIKDKEKIKNQQNFIDNYNKHQRNLVEYNTNQSTKEKTQKTTFTEIEKAKKENEKVSTKLKKLIKEEEI